MSKTLCSKMLCAAMLVTTGFVAKALERSNQPDATVAPPAEN